MLTIASVGQEGRKNRQSVSVCSFPVMPRLTENQQNQALGQLQAGSSVTDIALHFNVQRNTIYALQRRYLATGTTRDRVRSGRPRVTTAAQDRFMRISHLRNHFQTAQRTAETLPGGPRISSRTVRRRLAEAGIRAYLAAPTVNQTATKTCSGAAGLGSTPRTVDTQPMGSGFVF